MWDARRARNWCGGPIPPTPRPGEISPDGRWIAHIARNRVELIPLQPDQEELSYRRLCDATELPPLSGSLRRGDEGQRRVRGPLLPQSVPATQAAALQAEAIVAPCSPACSSATDVLAALQARPAADPEIQAACLKLAGTWPESAC